jgi:hypothetical protein
MHALSIVVLCAAAVLTLSLLLHYDFGYRAAVYTGPPVALAVRVPPACPVAGHAEVDGKLLPVRCGYVIHYYSTRGKGSVHVYADAPLPPAGTWVLLLGDSAAYLLERAPPPGCDTRFWCAYSGSLSGGMELPGGVSYIEYGGALYALLRAPDMQFRVEVPHYGTVEYAVHGVGPGAVHVLVPAAYRVAEAYAELVGTLYLWGDRELPLYAVGVAALERASLTRFVNVTAQQAPDAWPLYAPRIAAG